MEHEFDVVVLELSSFQLETLSHIRFDSAAILNITFSHGERYEQLREYAEAKYRLIDLMKPDGKFFFGEGLPYFENQLGEQVKGALPLIKTWETEKKFEVSII